MKYGDSTAPALINVGVEVFDGSKECILPLVEEDIDVVHATEPAVEM
jgi:hypothetical protein